MHRVTQGRRTHIPFAEVEQADAFDDFGYNRFIGELGSHHFHISYRPTWIDDQLSREIVTCGGIAEKNPLLMQIYADVLGRPMRISRSPQTCALGAAIFGAVAGAGHRNVEAAQKAMCGLKPVTYKPAARSRKTYRALFEQYMRLHDAFGDSERGATVGGVMKRLIELRDRVRGSA